MLLDFNDMFYLYETSDADPVISFKRGSNVLAVNTRSNLSAAISFYSNWHYMHMVYTDSPLNLDFYIDNIKVKTTTSTLYDFDFTQNKRFNIYLCPPLTSPSIP